MANGKFGTRFGYDGSVMCKDHYSIKHLEGDKDEIIEDLCTDYNNLARLYNTLVVAVMSSRNV